jgi:hypothetical protein
MLGSKASLFTNHEDPHVPFHLSCYDSVLRFLLTLDLQMKRNTNFSRASRQAGFSILGVILIVVAIVGVLGVWAMSGQTNTSGSASSASDVLGSSVLNDGSAVKTAFDTLLINGAAATAITYVPATAGATNMLDPSNGIQRPVPNSNAVGATAYPQGQWTYHTSFLVPGIGSASPDIAVVLPDVKDGVCQQINSRLYGSTVIPSSGLAESAFTTGNGGASAPSTSTALSLSTVTAINGWVSGCVSATGGTTGASNVYFRILKAQ